MGLVWMKEAAGSRSKLSALGKKQSPTLLNGATVEFRIHTAGYKTPQIIQLCLSPEQTTLFAFLVSLIKSK